MSSPPVDRDTLLTVARAHAADGAWDMLCASLAVHEAVVSAQPELALLLAEAQVRLGDAHSARQRLLEIIPALERARNDALLRRAVNVLGAAHLMLGDLGDAEVAFQRALELATRARDHLLIARATNNLGAIANIRGHRDAALSLYQRCVAAYQRIGSALGLAETFHNMAITFRDIRQLEQADEYEQRAVEYAREAGSARLLAMARAGRAELSLMHGDPRLAEAGARVAAREYAAVPDPAGEADALRLAGVACASLGAVDQALDALDRAVSLAHAHGSALIEAESLHARADVLALTESLAQAQDDARAALAIYTRLDAAEQRAAAECLLNRLLEKRALSS